MANIYAAKTNHVTNPMGFYMNHVVFSWKVAEAEGTRQESARIAVSDCSDMSRLIVDTGMRKEADSLGTEVDFDLQPRTRYYWTVTVKTDAGEVIESPVQWFETGKMEEPWQGKWITCENASGRHPIFEKQIAPEKKVVRARLYACGLGLYEAFYQTAGDTEPVKIGNEYLTPYSNDYNQWLQYQTYDVTEQLQQAGTLSFMLGNGWYKARFGFSAHEEKGYYGDSWKLIAELALDYEDGTSEIIGTDDSWEVKKSNIIFSSIYDGEQRDDTLEEAGAEQAVLADAPKGRLMERISLPVVSHETLTPVELIHTPAGELVFDMGQEITGIFKLRVNQPKGTKITIQTGEILQQGNFYNENLRTAKSEYIYISDGTETDIIPHFTFYGYRYVKIQGIPDLKVEDFTGIALYSDFDVVGKIETGNDMINRLISNVVWGMKDNFLDVPTDCPQRDERMGWTGDTQVFSPTASYIADTYGFYRKYLYDMAQEQLENDGMVQSVIPSFNEDGCSSVWGDAACIIPWNVYLFSGDATILKDQFESMKSWVDYIRRLDGDTHEWRYHFHYGDWLALDKLGAKDDEVMGATDEEFIANIYYAASADLVAKAAHVLGYDKEEKEYADLARQQWEEVKKEYYTATGRCAIKTQTAMVLTLKYHLSENVELIRNTLRKLLVENGGKLNTGFVGTPLLCNVLTDNGMTDMAYQLLLNEEYPGWLHEIKLGATTVWERWNSVNDDGSISSTGMNSLNHYSYGSILEWMFRHVAGINVSESAPGARSVAICPNPHWDLKRVSASYDSASGVYQCGWEIIDKQKLQIKITIPFGGEGRITLPLVPETVYEDAANPLFANREGDICIVGPGSYEVTYETTGPMKTTYNTDTPMRELMANTAVKAALSRAIPLDMIPSQYLDMSIKALSTSFGRGMDEEEIKQLDAMLAQF